MRLPAPTALLATALGSILAVGSGGCGEDCCTTDERAIPVTWSRGLVAQATADGINGGRPFDALVDTAGPISLFKCDACGGRPHVTTRTIRLGGAVERAVFRGIDTLDAAIGDAGDETAFASPLGVVGGDVLRNFDVELDLGRGPTGNLILWRRQGASDGFLSAAGYSVVHFKRSGGGELDADGKRDWVGRLFGLPAPPATLPRTRVVLRGCAAPERFDPDAAVPRCCRDQERRPGLNTGSDVSLVLATGTGPIVLGRGAWDRIAARTPGLGAPAPGAALLSPYLAGPVPASWTTLPRLALVDQESGDQTDPGPCVELGRARRIEQVARAQAAAFAAGEPSAACAEPCDRDPSDRAKAQNSAAYVELGAGLPVAVVDDASPLLQSLRFEIRPEGPEVDGLLGAWALAQLHLEIDYQSTDERLILSCAGGPCAGGDRDACWAAARCPRLPGRGSERSCFCLPKHGLPQSCATRPEAERCPP